jgi:hypothetical protein
MNISIHRVKQICLSSYCKNNNNQMELSFKSKGNDDVNISFFDLPEKQFNFLVAVLSDNNTTNWDDE